MKIPAYWKPSVPCDTSLHPCPNVASVVVDCFWKVILEHETCYDGNVFEEKLLEIVHHPERTSSVLMRTDILSDEQLDSLEKGLENSEVSIDGFVLRRKLHRRLVPRNPFIDRKMTQSVFVFHEDIAGTEKTAQPKRIVLFVPDLDEQAEGLYQNLPYYHPPVAAVAWIFEGPKIKLAYNIPTSIPTNPEDPLVYRLGRTANALLLILHRHCKGFVEGYKKRMHHDTVVERNAFQDTYVDLKTRYARKLVADWVERTDPKKHVFEDLAIAAFLIELWKQRPETSDKKNFSFVDIGCGNGLLVHILISEGYKGYGFDARERKSWAIFPDNVRECLRENILVPHFLPQADALETLRKENEENAFVKVHNGKFAPNTFLIGNHSDELTPYIPLLAALTPNSGYISIPCCIYDLAGAKVSWDLPKPRNPDHAGRYASYVEWTRQLAEQTGWEVEIEPLRIPSTRNYALIGRKCDLHEREDALDQILSTIQKNHGAEGFLSRAIKVISTKERGH
ncbi:tRNA methyltransferase [Schizosaccharomyces japonicus yFS275]|uniref:tRNA (uracil-O(2)-)-methyltransferase n=1 Tax=Schizosaccharomyces japonicus (strain yFS275 / FY16936) TaxID=402676 RepID=B6K419_SCHJY|nr:tRNA methyltransferase [Schizosaccharomyces japonicus yFS275]EEB08226.1 tRNA methyltransferase [Schizosaccharomyces japonicus yFS275]